MNINPFSIGDLVKDCYGELYVVLNVIEDKDEEGYFAIYCIRENDLCNLTLDNLASIAFMYRFNSEPKFFRIIERQKYMFFKEDK
jgi:hypothetical protein